MTNGEKPCSPLSMFFLSWNATKCLSVEIIAGKIVEEQAQLRRWLLEFKTLAMNGIDSSRDQGECTGAMRAAKVRDHHASGKGCGVATQFHDGLFYLWLQSHLLCTLCAHELLPWSSFLFHLLLIKISKLMACSV